MPLTPDGGQPYGYSGEWWDAGTELVYLRARYLRPELGVFTSRDPWPGDGRQPGTLQGYGYALGNPVRFTDPSGRCTVCIGAAVGFVGGFGLYSLNALRAGQQWDLGQAAATAGTMAIAGALIGSGVGAGAGATMATATITSVGVGMAAGGVGYVAGNLPNAQPFDTEDFVVTSAVSGIANGAGQATQLGRAGAGALFAAANAMQYQVINRDKPFELSGTAWSAATGLFGGLVAGPFPTKAELTTTSIRQITNTRFGIVDTKIVPEFLNESLRTKLPAIAIYNAVGSFISNCPWLLGAGEGQDWDIPR